MIIFSDLHARPESEDVVFDVLNKVVAIADQTGERDIASLGDLLHVRYLLALPLFYRLADFFAEHARRGKRWFLLPGNHDQWETSGRHAVELFAGIPGVRVYTEPTVDEHGVWLPYRKDVRKLVEFAASIPRMNAPAYLHHGIVGACMNSGVTAGVLDGIHPGDLPFGRVFCGHWHRHQTVGQCVYVGSPWQTRADEAGQEKYVLRTSGTDFVPIPIVAGRRYWRSPEDAQRLGVPGDLVMLPAGSTAPPQLLQRGFSVAVSPEQPVPVQRFAPGASLREYATSYVASKLPEGADPAYLLAVFDEVVSS